MAIKSISEAARELGYKTRSSLHNLMRDGLLDDWIRTDARGRRCLEMVGLQERVRQVVRHIPGNVVPKKAFNQRDLEVVLRVGDRCNALCEQYGWKTWHIAAEWSLIASAIYEARKQPS